MTSPTTPSVNSRTFGRIRRLSGPSLRRFCSRCRGDRRSDRSKRRRQIDASQSDRGIDPRCARDGSVPGRGSRRRSALWAGASRDCNGARGTATLCGHERGRQFEGRNGPCRDRRKTRRKNLESRCAVRSLSRSTGTPTGAGGRAFRRAATDGRHRPRTADPAARAALR